MTDHPAVQPNIPVATDAMAWTELFDLPNFQMRFRHLSKCTGPQPYKIGVALEELLPGNQNNPAHYHMVEEEHVYILSGSLTVRVGKAFHLMNPGDYIRFPAGSADEHCLYNHTSEVCRYMVIGDNDPLDVCVYPDSNKVGVTALGERFMRQHQDYWVGEGGLTGKDPGT